MEKTLSEKFLKQEIQVRCLDGAIYEGVLAGIGDGVATLTREENSTYIACDKIVAAWLRDPKMKATPTIGFLGA